MSSSGSSTSSNNTNHTLLSLSLSVCLSTTTTTTTTTTTKARARALSLNFSLIHRDVAEGEGDHVLKLKPGDKAYGFGSLSYLDEVRIVRDGPRLSFLLNGIPQVSF
jgi:hypothetical protein